MAKLDNKKVIILLIILLSPIEFLGGPIIKTHMIPGDIKDWG